MDKFDVVWAVERELERNPPLLDRFKWLLKVWNTHDDRLYEEFDPTKPYGADYKSDDA